ncbi:MAG TPA: mycofactocin precursor MftA [Acidimicrobiales bacterium]
MPTSITTDSTEAAPADEAAPVEDEALVEDDEVLIEEVSIDGMCGVY